MRKVVREYTTTTYTILECVDGKINEIDRLTVEGVDPTRARRMAMRKYPDRNVFLGDEKTVSAVYSMDASKFIELAEKTEIE